MQNVDELSAFERSALDGIVRGRPIGEDRRPDANEQLRVIRGRLIEEMIAGAHGPIRRLSLHGVLVEGDIDLGYLEWRGDLDLRFCRITGTLKINHMVLRGRLQLDHADIRRVEAEYAVIEGPFLLRDGCCRSGFAALGLRVSGSLNLRQSEFRAPEDKPNSAAISLFRAQLGDVFLTDCHLLGGLYANGATIERNIRLQVSVAKSRPTLEWESGLDTADKAISLQGASVGGGVYLSWEDPSRGRSEIAGTIVLTRMSCATLRLSAAEFQRSRLEVDHLTYERLAGVSITEWLEIIAKTEAASTQPFAQLAAYSDGIGRSDLARRVRIAMERRLTTELPRGSFESWRRRAWGWAVDYGYHPGRAIVWLLLTALLCTLILRSAGHFLVEKNLAGRGVHRALPSWVQAASLSADSLLPFAGLGVAKQWSADPHSVPEMLWLFLFVTLKFTAWGLAAVGLASVTGVLRRT